MCLLRTEGSPKFTQIMFFHLVRIDTTDLAALYVFAGLSTVQASGGLLGIYNGEALVFEESNWFIINVIKLVWRYGFQSLRMHMWVEDVLDKFMR